MKNLSSWYVWGKYYGYPSCCIYSMVSFYNRRPEDAYGDYVLRTEGKRRKFFGTGFIPCSKCNKLSTRHLQIKINKQRICPKPFPNELSFKDEFSFALRSDKLSKLEKTILIKAYED